MKIQRYKDTNNKDTKKKDSMIQTAYVGSLVTILILHALMVLIMLYDKLKKTTIIFFIM